jgi:ketosteroid isomerase-like protein
MSQDIRTRTEVDQQFDSLVGAIRRLDIDRIISVYSTDTRLVRVTDGRVIRGSADVATDFRRGFGVVRSVDSLSIAERHLVLLDSTTARLVVHLREVYTDTAGHNTALRGTWTSVWRRSGHGWRIISDTAIHVLDRG